MSHSHFAHANGRGCTLDKQQRVTACLQGLFEIPCCAPHIPLPGEGTIPNPSRNVRGFRIVASAYGVLSTRCASRPGAGSAPTAIMAFVPRATREMRRL